MWHLDRIRVLTQLTIVPQAIDWAYGFCQTGDIKRLCWIIVPSYPSTQKADSFLKNWRFLPELHCRTVGPPLWSIQQSFAGNIVKTCVSQNLPEKSWSFSGIHLEEISRGHRLLTDNSANVDYFYDVPVRSWNIRFIPFLPLPTSFIMRICHLMYLMHEKLTDPYSGVSKWKHCKLKAN